MDVSGLVLECSDVSELVTPEARSSHLSPLGEKRGCRFN